MIASSPASTHTLLFRSHGVSLRLILGDDALRHLLPDLLPHDAELLPGDPAASAETFTLLPPNATHGYRSYLGETLTGEHPDKQPVLEQFARDLMIHVADHAPDRVFLHAGVVAHRGRALVLPGPSFAGKSTLTAELLRQGATYLSDEYAVLDAAGRTHPYTRALQMRRPGDQSQQGIAAARFGAPTATAAYPVALVVFTEHHPGATWLPEHLTPGMALLEMLRHTIPVQRAPARVMATLAAMLAGAPAFRTPRDEAGPAATALLHWLESLPA